MKIKKANRKGSFLIGLGLLLIAAAFCLTGYNLWDEQRALQTVEQVREETKENVALEDAYEETEPAYKLNPEMAMPEKEIDGWKYIGVLTIPSQGIELPVISEWSYPALKVAPCRYMGSAYKDDFIIAGHNYRVHLGRIKNLQPGDMVYFTDMDGNEFQYEVVVCETLMPRDIEGMKSGEWDLTLFTCTLGGQYRVTVRCEKVK